MTATVRIIVHHPELGKFRFTVVPPPSWFSAPEEDHWVVTDSGREGHYDPDFDTALITRLSEEGHGSYYVLWEGDEYDEMSEVWDVEWVTIEEEGS